MSEEITEVSPATTAPESATPLPLVLLVLGAVLMVAGAAVSPWSWSAFVVAGILLVAAGVDLIR